MSYQILVTLIYFQYLIESKPTIES